MIEGDPRETSQVTTAISGVLLTAGKRADYPPQGPESVGAYTSVVSDEPKGASLFARIHVMAPSERLHSVAVDQGDFLSARALDTGIESPGTIRARACANATFKLIAKGQQPPLGGLCPDL